MHAEMFILQKWCYIPFTHGDFRYETVIALLYLTWLSIWDFSDLLGSSSCFNIYTSPQGSTCFHFDFLIQVLPPFLKTLYLWIFYMHTLPAYWEWKSKLHLMLKYAGSVRSNKLTLWFTVYFFSINIFLRLMCIISLQTYKAYRGGVFTLTRLLIPAWIVHYYVKYHVAVSQQKC